MALFLLIDGIEGDSTEPGFSGWIEIFSFSWGIANSISVSSGAGGAGSGKVSISDITIGKTLSLGSPLLALGCATGEHFKGVQIADTRSANGKEVTYLKYVLTEVFITSYQVSADTGGKPSESISLNFGKIQIEYTPRVAGGPVNQDVTISQNALPG